MPILLEDLNLKKAERMLCERALESAGSIVEAAQLLGITRHALKRRIIKHRIEWPRREAPRPVAAQNSSSDMPNRSNTSSPGVPPHSINSLA